MQPVFLSITSTGQLWFSADIAFVPAGTVVQSFRISSLSTNQLIATLTGSGNASASALAVVTGTSKRSGKAEGQEIQ